MTPEQNSSATVVFCLDDNSPWYTPTFEEKPPCANSSLIARRNGIDSKNMIPCLQSAASPRKEFVSVSSHPKACFISLSASSSTAAAEIGDALTAPPPLTSSVGAINDARVHAPHQLAEALACGSVPVLASAAVDVADYEDPLVEGVHYLADEAQIERLGLGKETEMRSAGRAYYERNCSPDGFMRKLMARYFGI